MKNHILRIEYSSTYALNGNVYQHTIKPFILFFSFLPFLKPPPPIFLSSHVAFPLLSGRPSLKACPNLPVHSCASSQPMETTI